MNLKFIDWIWHVRGRLALAPGQSSEQAFDALAPLFQETGTSHDRANDTLTFSKKDQPAQDKMSVFDSGVLRIENGAAAPLLRYHLISRSLLFCFLAPLMFLAFGQLTLFLAKYEKPATDAASAAAKKQKMADAKKAPPPQNAIDKALGAPAPEKPGKDAPDKRKKKPSATTAYVFAAIFATLYLIGRIWEDRMVRVLFRKRLLGA